MTTADQAILDVLQAIHRTLNDISGSLKTLVKAAELDHPELTRPAGRTRSDSRKEDA